MYSTQSNKYLHANPVQMHTLAHWGRLLRHLLLHLQSSLEAMMHSYLLEEVIMILDKEHPYLPGSILRERGSVVALFFHTFHTTFACYHYSSYNNYSLCFVFHHWIALRFHCLAGTSPSTPSSSFVLHNSKMLFWERDKYSETNTHDSYTIHPFAMEPSCRALCLTKPLRVFINLSKKNIHRACTVPAISTSSTKCTSKCTWTLRILVVKCSSNRHTVLMASSFARTIVDGLISLQDIHLKVQGLG